MARKAGQLISRGPQTWLVRVSLGQDLLVDTQALEAESGADGSTALQHTACLDLGRGTHPGQGPTRQRARSHGGEAQE